MANVETEAIVLRSYNLSDADKIVVFLTKDQGVIKGVAKGAKRLKSKFGSSLEPFSVVNLIYHQKEDRELNTIKQIDLIKSFFKNTSHIEFLNKFEYFAELLIGFIPINDPNERVYGMSKVCLQTASTEPESLGFIELYFEIWLLKLGGFLPSWENCSNCRKDFELEENSSLQIDNGLLCKNCQNFKASNEITPKHRKLYNYVQNSSPIKFIEVAREHQFEVSGLSGILKQIISKVLGKANVGAKNFTANNNSR